MERESVGENKRIIKKYHDLCKRQVDEFEDKFARMLAIDHAKEIDDFIAAHCVEIDIK
jgi:hypothetical protein